MNIDCLYRIYDSHPKIVTDSRKACANSIFFALKGESFDGNDFAAQALSAGCNYAVVDRPEVLAGDRYVLVDNVLNTLHDLARKHRKQLNIPVIAVTGTNGKTTTRELIKCVLDTQYKVHATSGNLNNHIGVPLTILEIPLHTQIAIIEMGANHAGEICELCDIAQPTCGLITNVGKAHLEGFGSFDGIKRAKKELYDYLNNSGGMIFYNKKNRILTEMLENVTVKTVDYGNSGCSGCWGTIISAAPYLQAELHIGENAYRLSTHMAGVYNMENLLAAACAGCEFSVPEKQIVSAIAAYTPQNSRSQILHTVHNQLLLDYYNANPTSMSEALNSFFQQIQNPKMVILGDMFELGNDAQKEHAAIINLLVTHNDVRCAVVGEYFHEAAMQISDVFAFHNMTELKRWLAENPPAGMFILLKGSRKMKMEQLVDLL